MSFKYLNILPSPDDIKSSYPLKDELVLKKQKFDKEVYETLTGKKDKFLVIIGPCSADNEEAVCDFANRLNALKKELSDKLIIIPRVYTNKPRTTGDGYKGLLHQPNPEKEPDILNGIIASRKIHLRVIEETNLFTADEILYPENLDYLNDLVSYMTIGARSVENQQHRLIASACDIPVGMKNPTSGDLSVMLNAIYTAQKPHECIHRGWEIQTDGNKLAHAILRGATDRYGNTVVNYHYEDLMLLFKMYGNYDIKNPTVIIDANHSNSAKQFKEQLRIVREILYLKKTSKMLNDFIKGVMIESYLVEGSQKIGEHIYGKSITDPCLGWEDTKKLLLDISDGI